MSMPSSHSELYRTSSRSSSTTRRNCSSMCSAFASTTSFVEPRPRLRLPGRIADASGEVADDEDGGVAGVLEPPELAQHDGPSEGDVGRGRVEPELHPQRAAERELLLEPALGNDLGGPVLSRARGSGAMATGCYQCELRAPRVDSPR